MKQKGISTQAQEAIKEDFERQKVKSKKFKKQRDDAFKQKQWEIKKQKAKKSIKGNRLFKNRAHFCNKKYGGQAFFRNLTRRIYVGEVFVSMKASTLSKFDY